MGLSLPEKTIMKSLAIFKLRKWKFLFGFIMVLDLYTDVTFPFMARSCDMDLTTRWQIAWGKIPFFGIVLVGVLEIFKFWGLAMVFILIHISLDGGFGICHMITATELVYDGEYGSGPRVTSQMFFSVAENSDTALLPSVAMFCREMANQKRFVFNEDADTLKAMQARENEMLGLVVHEQKSALTLFKADVYEQVEKAEFQHFVHGLVIKVLFGNAAMLWLQASFFGLSYELLGLEAKIKLVLSMTLSMVVALTRCWIFSARAGKMVYLVLGPCVLLIFWAVVKVIAAIFSCEDHIWNLTTGCVHVSRKWVQEASTVSTTRIVESSYVHS